MTETQARLMENVSPAKVKNGCWEWVGKKFDHGYGRLNLGGKSKRAHRVAYEEFVGPIPNGLDLLHSCHNRGCINPDHLRPGTKSQNQIDRVAKDRTGTNKLTAEQVHKIRDYRRLRVPRRVLSEMFGVGQECIRDIDTGETWSWLK